MKIADLAPLAIVMVVLAIVIGMGATILSEMEDNTWESLTETNESMGNITTVPHTYTVSDASSDTEFEELTSVTCYNDSANSGTETCSILSASDGTVNVTTNTDDTENEYITYTYDRDSDASNTIDDGVSAMSDFSGWFGILVLIVIASIVIGIIGKLFSTKSRRI